MNLEVYDKAKWHFDSTNPKLSDDERWERAAAHIGVFVRWLAERGFLLPGEAGAECNNVIALVRVGNTTGTKFLRDCTDFTFSSDNVEASVHPFVSAYMGDKGACATDLVRIVGDNFFEISEKDMPYSKIKSVVDGRYSRFMVSGAKAVQTSILDKIRQVLKVG